MFLKEMHRRISTNRPQPQSVRPPPPQIRPTAPPNPQPSKPTATTQNAPLIPSKGVPFIPPHRRIQNKPAAPPISPPKPRNPPTMSTTAVPFAMNGRSQSGCSHPHSHNDNQTVSHSHLQQPTHSRHNTAHTVHPSHPSHVQQQPHQHPQLHRLAPSLSNHQHSGNYPVESPSIESLPPPSSTNGPGSLSSFDSPFSEHKAPSTHSTGLPPGMNLKRTPPVHSIPSISGLGVGLSSTTTTDTAISSSTASLPQHSRQRNERKMAKINNILNMKRSSPSIEALGSSGSRATSPLTMNSQDGQRYLRKPSPRKIAGNGINGMNNGMPFRLRWLSENCPRDHDIVVVSDEDDISDGEEDAVTIASETATNTTNKSISKQNSVQNSVHSIMSLPSLHNDGDEGDDGDYDYSDSEDDVVPFTVQPPVQRPPMNHMNKRLNGNGLNPVVQHQPPPHRVAAVAVASSSSKIEGMTIQRMLDNLDDLQGHEVDAILANLLSKKDGKEEPRRRSQKRVPFNPMEVSGAKIDGDLDLEMISKIMSETTPPSSVHNQVPAPSKLAFVEVQPMNPISPKHQNGHHRIPSPSPQRKSVIFSMERHRRDMELIAKSNAQFYLAAFPEIYHSQFGRNVKSTYNGKIKELVAYFCDIFKMEMSADGRGTNVISLLFDGRVRIQSQSANHSKHSSPTNSVHGSAKKKKQKAVWTPKSNKKKIPRMQQEEELDFRNGPSAMYQQPRTVPIAHHHIIGQTAAVGTANAYNSYGSNSRPYLSSRKHCGYGGAPKVKTYGDYEDELPHTPSGSEEDE